MKRSVDPAVARFTSPNQRSNLGASRDDTTGRLRSANEKDTRGRRVGCAERRELALSMRVDALADDVRGAVELDDESPSLLAAFLHAIVYGRNGCRRCLFVRRARWCWSCSLMHAGRAFPSCRPPFEATGYVSIMPPSRMRDRRRRSFPVWPRSRSRCRLTCRRRAAGHLSRVTSRPGGARDS
jgi:hypothetical protein